MLLALAAELFPSQNQTFNKVKHSQGLPEEDAFLLLVVLERPGSRYSKACLHKFRGNIQ